MSRKKRALERQKKQTSPVKKAKNAKKAYYASYSAREKRNDKKARKEQSQLTQRESRGISVDCPLKSWEKPSIDKCTGCKLKCSFKSNA